MHGSFKEKICSSACCIFFGLLITLSFFVAEETDFRFRHPEESIPGTYEGALCGHGYEPYDSSRECASGIVAIGLLISMCCVYSLTCAQW